MSAGSQAGRRADWRHTLALPDGTRVRGRGVRDALPDGDRPEFGLYLGVDYEPDWEHVTLDWPNHFLPRDHVAAAGVIGEVSERLRDGQRVEVACMAGRGRTGTVLSCLAILAGVRPDHAVSWVRAHYEARACRPPWQRHYVLRFPQLLASATGEADTGRQ
jgi:hypothetical protein